MNQVATNSEKMQEDIILTRYEKEMRILFREKFNEREAVVCQLQVGRRKRLRESKLATDDHHLIELSSSAKSMFAIEARPENLAPLQSARSTMTCHLKSANSSHMSTSKHLTCHTQTATTTRAVHHLQPNQRRKYCQQLSKSVPQNLLTASSMMLLLLVVTSSCLAWQATGNSQQPRAEPIMMARNSNGDNGDKPDVITIKFANVTDTNKDSGEQLTSTTNQEEQDNALSQQIKLNVYKLDEPLSVSVIESKFAHSIQLFDVSNNQLSTLSKDLFCPLSNEVRQLNISYNLLENFDCLGLISQNGQLCLSELRILDMSYNLIKHLPATGVATLHNLEILNLSHNLIESLDELSLSSLVKLTKLDLSANRIQQLPVRIFAKSSSMQVLRLQSNSLQTSISQMFLSGLISLEEINLSHNNISHLSDLAFLDKINLTRVDLTYNQLSTLKQETLRVTSVKQAIGYRPRLHHNGQYAGVSAKQAHSQSASAEFLLSSNPFICDCQLDWLRKFQPTSAIKRTVLTSSSSTINNNNRLQMNEQINGNNDQLGAQLLYQNDQPPVISASSSPDSSNNISEINSNSQQQGESMHQQQQQQLPGRPTMATLLTNGVHHYARIGDLDLMKCTPLFRRNAHRNQQQYHNHHNQVTYHRHANSGQSRTSAPSDGAHLAHSHHHHIHQQQQQQATYNNLVSRHQQQQDTMIDLLGADSSNFLCRYKSHCFALCQCCEFDACDCEMICPIGCNCYYDSTWQTNIIDCSSSNHTVVPDRIPMDVSGLYLDGNDIISLKPSNLIARKSLKTLYLNSSNLQYIANRTFNGLIELQTLYLHDNTLRSLNGYEFEPLAKLKALYLQSNRLDHINNQTFIYLRSLEVLDLSNNRLTSANLDLFWSIGHHNIRLRQLNIAHNWWSCQCSSINRFRQILKQKFLLNGSVNIADKNQLRCYYNSTTVGPLILSDGLSPSNALQQPVYASYPVGSSSSLASSSSSSSSLPSSATSSNSRQQTLLTEINQCSELIEDSQEMGNPPIIHEVTDLPAITTPQEFPNDRNYPSPDIYIQSQSQLPAQTGGILDQAMYNQPGLIVPAQVDSIGGRSSGQQGSGNNGQSGSSLPLTSFILLSMLSAIILVISLSVFVFVRQQQQQRHHKKSSAASTTSGSSSASSTAISSLNGKSHHQRHHEHHVINPHQQTMHNGNHHHHQPQQQQHHHLIMSNGTAGGHTNTIASHLQHQSLHHHSVSSQSNIYAALVSPGQGNSTTLTNQVNNMSNNNANNLYSNSSTTASHHSGGSSRGQYGANASGAYPQHWAPLVPGQQALGHNQHPYGESHYAINASNASNAYKSTGGSLYNCRDGCSNGATLTGQQQAGDWLKLPKVKQFMSKLVNKSLALGGYRSCSRDELSAITSDKIYDAFLSYDKRDEAFVMQHLSAELEYGQPQYRIADRFRDLPLPSSAYIAEAITSVIGCSHRTIMVLTENYLSSEWCRYELEAALNEANLDKSHKIIAVVLDPKCLLEMDTEMRALLTNSANGNVSIYQMQQQQQQQQQLPQLVQLDNCANELHQQQQLIATLTNQNGAHQQVSTKTAQLATSKITFINYNERKFWTKIKQLMPMARPSTQTLTLTTKN